MALGVQLSSKYELIGGPREAGNRRRNLITNPRAGVDLTGIGAVTAGVTLNRIQQPSGVVPAGFQTGVLSTGTSVATSTAISASYGRGPNSTGVDAHPVTPNSILMIRGIARITSITLGAISNLALRAYFYQASGAASATSFATVQAQASPGIGPTYEYIGFVTVPADAAFAVPRFLATQTNPSSWVIRSTGMAMYEVESALVPAVEYVDGDEPGWYWIGTPHASESWQDGTRAVLNDETDPDFVGYAMEVTGLEGAEVRENVVENIEADGAIHGEFYQGRRPVTITAAIGGNVTPTTRNSRQQRWLSASRALRTRGVSYRPATLFWQPDGAPVKVFTTLRRQQRPTLTGLVLKEASVAMIAADPRIYGVDQQVDANTLSGSATAGRTYDRSYNVNYDWAAQRAAFTLTNIGDADAPVIIQVLGGMSTIAVQNLTTGEEVSLNGAIVAGQTITIDTGAKTVTLQDGTNLFDRVAIGRTRWWGLAPGVNTISVLADTFDGSSSVRVYWRPAWA